MRRMRLAMGLVLALEIGCTQSGSEMGGNHGDGGSSAGGTTSTSTGGQGGGAGGGSTAGVGGTSATNGGDGGGAGGHGGAAVCGPDDAVSPSSSGYDGEVCPSSFPFDLSTVSCLPGFRCHLEVFCCGQSFPTDVYGCTCSGRVIGLRQYDPLCLTNHVCPVGGAPGTGGGAGGGGGIAGAGGAAGAGGIAGAAGAAGA